MIIWFPTEWFPQLIIDIAKVSVGSLQMHRPFLGDNVTMDWRCGMGQVEVTKACQIVPP